MKSSCTRIVLVLCALALLTGPAWATERARGFVDGSFLVEFAGEDAVSVEVNISRSLITVLLSGLPELKEAAGGLDSIHAVVLDLSKTSGGDRLERRMREMAKDLRGKGWEALAVIKEDDEEIRVLVLSDEGEGTIEGLVVMVVGEDELVFANIAGAINLAELRRIGESLDLPGLDQLGEIDDP